MSLIKEIEATRIIQSPPTAQGPYSMTFYYEEGENYAVDQEGSVHQIHNDDTWKEVEESESWLAYGNEDEKFFTNYAEDGDYKHKRNQYFVSDEMKIYLNKKGI